MCFAGIDISLHDAYEGVIFGRNDVRSESKGLGPKDEADR